MDALSFSRAWAMPSANTLSVGPIRAFARRYAYKANRSVDPFARNSRIATVTNDINPETAAQYHMDAEAFCLMLAERGERFDLAIFDPPYSPRQISEVYQSIGLNCGMRETQSGALYRRVRDALDKIMLPGGVVLSFGWNSVGMGEGRGYSLSEIMIVCHGGAHNDTICVAEVKQPRVDLFGEAA